MVKLTNVLILASGLAATAFSLERPVQRISGSNKIGATFSKSPSFQHSAPSYLKSAEDNRYRILFLFLYFLALYCSSVIERSDAAQ
jgi:hypothetical protein